MRQLLSIRSNLNLRILGSSFHDCLISDQLAFLSQRFDFGNGAFSGSLRKALFHRRGESCDIDLFLDLDDIALSVHCNVLCVVIVFSLLQWCQPAPEYWTNLKMA